MFWLQALMRAPTSRLSLSRGGDARSALEVATLVRRIVALDCKAAAADAGARCVELHSCGVGSSLDDPMHFDSGSIVTLDVMLDEADAGGVFETLEADGGLKPHVFERGDAIVVADDDIT